MRLFRRLRWWVVGQSVPFFRGPDPRHVRQRNIWHLYQDLVWLGLATAATSYVSVYAIRLGASDRLLGLLTSVPSLLMVLLRMPAARLTERTADRKSLIVRSLLLRRLGYLVICLLPWLALLPGVREIPPATLLVGVVILMAVPMVLSSAGWDSFFADVVPPRRRSRVVSTRSTMTALISLAMVPVMGSFLEWAPFPHNYQVIYLLAFVGATVSLWHVHVIKSRPATQVARRHSPLSLAEARRILQDSPEFAALVLGTFVYQLAISIVSPLFSIYFIEHLGASESWIGWRLTLASLMSILAYRIWPTQIEKRGDVKMLILASPMMALFPLLTGLTSSLTPNLFIVLLPQLFGSCVLLSRYSILLRVTPADRRPTYIAIYAILANVAAFIAPLVGVALVDVIGITRVFFVAAGLRLTAALLYRRLPSAARQAEAAPA
ncbi:MAG: MFS transporter [Anaerolineae bacterium]|nr:MFS transporter [Anaerolineae bacterium]